MKVNRGDNANDDAIPTPLLTLPNTTNLLYILTLILLKPNHFNKL